ncbi:MAG: glycosyltransferase family 4 protein [Ignavibacteriaceae bacterium]
MKLGKIYLLNLMKTFDIGGTERSTIIYSNHLVKKIGKVFIIAPKGFYNRIKIISEEVKVFNFKYKLGYNPLTFFINLFFLSKVIRNEKINVINYHQRILLPYIFFIKFFFKKIKIIYTGHAVFYDSINKFLTADIFIAISNAVKNDFIKANKKNIYLIKHGIEINTNIAAENSTVEYFGFVGRFTEGKGIITLLYAFKLFHQRNQNQKIIFRGEGNLQNKMENFIAENSLEDFILIKKPEENINKIFDKIDVLIFPSEIEEGFGLVILEAMSRNIAIIKSYWDKDEEFFNDKTCFLFEPKNVNELVEKMEEVVLNSEKRKKLLQNSKGLVKEHFDINRFMDEYLKLLSEI